MRHAQCLIILGVMLLAGCDGQPWNDPYPKQDREANIFYSSFTEQPRTLDPAKAFSSNEYQFIGQIYEPPLQYDYLQRPYALTPLLASEKPTITYLDEDLQPLSSDNIELTQIAYTRYTVTIKPEISYQKHPALATNEQEQYHYHDLPAGYLDQHDINTLSDFTHTGTREVTAEDFVYQIKRLAHPNIQSPILGLMSEHIVGLTEFSQRLQSEQNKLPPGEWLDIRADDFPGAQAVDRYTYQILIKQKYPQFSYWLAMPFFSPIPWEADTFSAQPGMRENNITLDWYPIGTGPYALTQNNPNRQIVLQKNPHFHPEYYPSNSDSNDPRAGQRLPFIDKAIFVLERESIPRWSKFLQGYYDSSGVTADSFDQAIEYDGQGNAELSDEMRARDIHLTSEVEPSVFYWGFNMLDAVVGGDDEASRKLRHAINIVLPKEEFIDIFLNGRGAPADGPVPPGIFGYEVTQYEQKTLADAQRLLVEAGYPHGRNANTGEPLVLHFDAVSTGAPDDQARFAWLRKQFAQLGIQLNIRATQFNRFQEKLRNGQAQIFFAGWYADYPDPENFLFLFYGPNSKVLHGGENAVNYQNEHYDQLFEKMEDMPNSPQRQVIIDEMVSILQHDAPWAWGFYPVTLTLTHAWMTPNQPIAFGSNTLKYAQLNPEIRSQERKQWNQPVLWPLLVLLLLGIILCVPVAFHYWQKVHKPRTSSRKT